MNNLNETIKIQLTPNGIEYYKNYLDRIVSVKYYPGLSGEILTIKMWEFMQIFGKELYMGNPTPLHLMSFEYVKYNNDGQINTNERTIQCTIH